MIGTITALQGDVGFDYEGVVSGDRMEGEVDVILARTWQRIGALFGSDASQ